MNKRLILVLAIALVAGLTCAAYAEVQNVKVSGDILMQGVARERFQSINTADHDRAILSAVRVRVDADLTDNVATCVRLMNEREWQGDTAAGAADSNIDLDLAFVTLKEFLTVPVMNAPVTFIVGRQELSYGNNFIIGSAGSLTTNLPGTLRDLSVDKAFDAVKAVLNYDPLVIDFVVSKIEENTSTRQDDVNLMGINASYAVDKNLNTEAYLWSRARNFGSTGLTATTMDETLNVLGARGVYTGIKNMMIGLEGAYQFGDHVASAILYPNETLRTSRAKVGAYGIQLVTNYMMPDVKFTPSLAFSYTMLSGDKDGSTSDNYKGWDPMFKYQGAGTIFNRLLGYSNASIVNLGGSMKPMDDVTVKLDWYNLGLVQPFHEAGDADGVVTKILTGVVGDPATIVRIKKHHLADEIDLGITYDYTEDVQLGLTGGIYVPGSVYDKVNSKNATQVIGSMKVTF